MVRFGLLGTLLVRTDDGAERSIGGPLPRALLAVLLLAEGRPVAADRLLDDLWDGEPTAGATAGTFTVASKAVTESRN